MSRLRLILMRHGEAEEGFGMPDHARRLTAHGTTEVRKVAKVLVEAGWAPTFALASDATRTKDTAVSANLELPVGVEWHFSEALYLAGLDRIQDALRPVDATKHHTVLLLGHNPGFSSAATTLTASPVGLSTGAAAVMTVEAADWVEAAELLGSWTLERIVTP
jgi:phosphohistidine phosphatase